MSLPIVQADVTFLTTAEGGRRTVPGLCREYRPHIVVQSPDVRHAEYDEHGHGCEHYLGVCFLATDHVCKLGNPVEVTMELMYHPHVDYSEVLSGSTFTIREGGKIVGFGTVLSRTDPDGATCLE